jgi:N-succinyldiaminopimelate aminotransferase
MGNVFSATRSTIFDSMSALARQHKAVNLGQGFPDDLGPQLMREKAADEVINGWNQYPPMMGV